MHVQWKSPLAKRKLKSAAPGDQRLSIICPSAIERIFLSAVRCWSAIEIEDVMEYGDILYAAHLKKQFIQISNTLKTRFKKFLNNCECEIGGFIESMSSASSGRSLKAL